MRGCQERLRIRIRLAVRCGKRWFWPVFGVALLVLSGFGGAAAAAESDARRQGRESALDRLIAELERSEAEGAEASAGSLYEAGARLADLARDPRAVRVHDLVTIVVSDHASAVSRGATKSARTAQAKGNIAALAGPLRAAGPLAQMANLGGNTQLDGQGETSRESVLETTLSARVTHVLPNGNLVVEGTKEVWINSERQRVTVRGLLRWNDLTPGNRVSSDRLADLEVRVEGKGVIHDALRRPNFLYRLLTGLLPF